jgi:hypothetical protein
MESVSSRLRSRADAELIASRASDELPGRRRSNPIPRVVFSSSIERADWPESRIARGDLAEEVRA